MNFKYLIFLNLKYASRYINWKFQKRSSCWSISKLMASLGNKKIRQLFVSCLYLFAVINFFWLMHPLMTNGVSVHLYFSLPACFTIRFNVIVLRNSLFHILLLSDVQRYYFIFYYALFALSLHTINQTKPEIIWKISVNW